MKIWIIITILVMQQSIIADEINDELQNARDKGADAKIVLRCIDQYGGVVTNATVSTALYPDGGFVNAIIHNGITDTNGIFEMKGKTNGEFTYSLSKNGYYKTREQKFLFELPNCSIKDGRWQPYGMTNTVVLKRSINPVAMYVRQGSTPLHLPKQGEFTGFDLEYGDWVSPHGKGKRGDFQVLFNLDAKDDLWLAFRCTLTFRFPKPFDGVYRMKKDGWSALKSTPLADTNRTYHSEIIFTSERRYDEAKRRSIVVNDQLEEDEYLVLRVRSETNEEGKLVKANYAKIYGSLFAAKYGLVMTSYFNPKENNPSLEADPMKNLRDPNDLGFTP